jgi:hypothetical protein
MARELLDPWLPSFESVAMSGTPSVHPQAESATVQALAQALASGATAGRPLEATPDALGLDAAAAPGPAGAWATPVERRSRLRGYPTKDGSRSGITPA